MLKSKRWISQDFWLVALGLSCLMALAACQSPRLVVERFHDAVVKSDGRLGADRTSVVFLIDGLSSEILKRALMSGNAPHIDRYFSVSRRRGYRLGRASFPSLTYPNLASILTGKTVAHHPITGNRVLVDGEEVNFENILSWRTLDRLLRDRTVFHRLSARNETSVSFSYPFPRGTTSHLEKNIEAGINYLEKNFDRIDADVLVSARTLLEKTAVEHWPRFIFVHLIGVDSIAHQFGPDDKRVQSYLRQLDSKLKDVFELLRQGEARGRSIQAVLTTDHGFATTHHRVPLAELVAKLNRDIRVVSDNRLASLYLKPGTTLQERRDLADSLLVVPHVSMTAVKVPDGIEIYQRSGPSTTRRARIDVAPANCSFGNQSARFRFLDAGHETDAGSAAPSFCLEDFDRNTGTNDDTFMIPALVEYFAGPASPDLIVLPDGSSDFTGAHRGNHGGLTKDEILVPLLTHRVDLPNGVIPTSSLIHLLGLPD